MKLHCVDALSLPFHMVTETSPQPVPIKKKKKAKNRKKDISKMV